MLALFRKDIHLKHHRSTYMYWKKYLILFSLQNPSYYSKKWQIVQEIIVRQSFRLFNIQINPFQISVCKFRTFYSIPYTKVSTFRKSSLVNDNTHVDFYTYISILLHLNWDLMNLIRYDILSMLCFFILLNSIYFKIPTKNVD